MLVYPSSNKREESRLFTTTKAVYFAFYLVIKKYILYIQNKKENSNLRYRKQAKNSCREKHRKKKSSGA